VVSLHGGLTRVRSYAILPHRPTRTKEQLN